MGIFSRLFSRKKASPPAKFNNTLDNAGNIFPQYIETDTGIQRVDGKPFTDEDVPYLMQLDYEKALEKEGLYNSEMLDLSFMKEQNKDKKLFTALPSYEELYAISPVSAPVPITSTDIFFLKYINGRVLEHPEIAQYWFYDYKINYSEEIKKLILCGLLSITNVYLKKLSVEELKKILRHFNLSVSGRKAELQERIKANVNAEDLSVFLGHLTHYLCITDKGLNYINSIHESATRNIELEDECLDLITNYNFEAAYNLIWGFKSKKGADIRCRYIVSEGDKYRSIMDSHTFFYTLEKDRELESKLRASIIFCKMYGLGYDNLKKMVKRIYIENGHEFSNDAKNNLSGRQSFF